MKTIHVECNADETLITSLGITKKHIQHHSGKSRVFNALKSCTNHLAVVDEDPSSAVIPFQRILIFKEEKFGIKKYIDNNQNIILELKEKLENWLVYTLKLSGRTLDMYGLPDHPNTLHRTINSRLPALEKMIKKELSSNKPLKYLNEILNAYMSNE